MDQIDTWLEIGHRNWWITRAWDPPFNRRSFYECTSTDELRAKLHGNWCTGQAFYYRDLCFIQQDEGGDEWLTIRHGIAFESISWQAVMAQGGTEAFDALLGRLLAATPEQCRELTY